ncbi:hypothetical protein NQ317_015863 [Molorchus minor]|uniref:Uncharacterized protein n=1 Tax=Molorchus minor TaxID=1323400 RepID=A0ABQ9JJI6_9CUCU|nr:hypothetical protein NQ317_015863 [Molorchus minor]
MESLHANYIFLLHAHSASIYPQDFWKNDQPVHYDGFSRTPLGQLIRECCVNVPSERKRSVAYRK